MITCDTTKGIFSIVTNYKISSEFNRFLIILILIVAVLRPLLWCVLHCICILLPVLENYDCSYNATPTVVYCDPGISKVLIGIFLKPLTINYGSDALYLHVCILVILKLKTCMWTNCASGENGSFASHKLRSWKSLTLFSNYRIWILWPSGPSRSQPSTHCYNI